MNTAIEQHAFLLHCRPYRENQLLVDLLTEHDGKVGALIYSGKSPKSNKKSILQPFNPLRVALKGRASLKTLSLVESSGKSLALSGNHLFSGFYVNELLVKLLPELIPCDKLYQQYVDTIFHLGKHENIEPSLRTFELTLLEEMGIALDYAPAYMEAYSFVTFSSEHGFIPSSREKGGYNREHIMAIAENQIGHPDVLLTFKRLMRQIIDQLLGHRPLNSRKLFMK